MKTFGSSEKFIQGKSLEWENVAEGVKRKIMGYDDKIMLVHVYLREDAVRNQEREKRQAFGPDTIHFIFLLFRRFLRPTPTQPYTARCWSESAVFSEDARSWR